MQFLGYFKMWQREDGNTQVSKFYVCDGEAGGHIIDRALGNSDVNLGAAENRPSNNYLRPMPLSHPPTLLIHIFQLWSQSIATPSQFRSNSTFNYYLLASPQSQHREFCNLLLISFARSPAHPARVAQSFPS
jgi:hypothetical protein